MNNTMSKNKYDKELVRDIIERKRGALLIEQLFEALPEEQRPARKYFVEFLRSIPGVYTTPYDLTMNRLFATTLHGSTRGKRKLLVMVAAWEKKYQTPATWYAEVSGLPRVYGELIKGFRINVDDNGEKHDNPVKLLDSYV